MSQILINGGFSIAKKAIDLVKKGVAEFGSGGVRMKDTQQLVAQYRPAGDNILEKQQLLNAVGGGGGVGPLQWVNLALQLANLAVTIVGFYLTLSRMESLHGEIKEFIEKYKADQDADQFEKYKSFLNKMTSQINFLKNRYTQEEYDKTIFMIRETDIEKECDETAGFLERIINQYQKKELGTELACNIIFTLTPVFAQLVKEFCYQYYLVHGTKHHQYESWKNILDRINSDGFHAFMKKEMAFNIYYLNESALNRSSSLKVLFDSMKELADDMETSMQLAADAPRDKLISVSELAGIKAWKEIRDRIAIQENETPEEYITRRIMQIEINDGDDEVYIPFQVSCAH